MMPAIIPGIGLENKSRIFVNSGTSANGLTAADMVSIPIISTAKPIRIVAAFLCFSFPEKSSRITPTRAKICEKAEGFKSCITKLPLSMPVRLKIHDVIVVPTLAPIMIPMAWDSFIIPELTNPTTITVVAEEDWITAVTPAPNSTARHLL